MFESSHVAYEDCNKIKCSRCLDSVSTGSSFLRSWLKAPCSKIASSSDRPVPVRKEIISIGHLSSHSSHKLNVYRGLVFCIKCGCRGPTKLVHLAKPCEPAKLDGKKNIKALLQGKLPPGLCAWPDEQHPPTSAEVVADSLINSATKLNATEKQGLKAFASAFTEHASTIQHPPSYIDGFSDVDASDVSERSVADLFKPTSPSSHSSDLSD